MVLALLILLAPVQVGSKKFTESVVLGELLKQLGAEAGVEVEHRRELGGTRVLWSALKKGEIDAYVEYTGTLRQEIFKGRQVDDLRAAVQGEGLRLGEPLGFNNTYALGMLPARADRLRLKKVSDLKARPELRFRFGNEFMDRGDGWPGLRARYGLPQKDVAGLDHDLAYRGLLAEDFEVMDLYSTDAEIAAHGLRVLEDDRGYFPRYDAVLVWRADLDPTAVKAFRRLEAQLDEASMAGLNAQVRIDKVPEATAAAGFLRARLGATKTVQAETRTQRLVRHSGAHLRLIELPLAARSILAGIKTSAVINVGTATLGALIGAGGYGQPILTGIRLDDVGLILEGAVPAALLALLVQGLFELWERRYA